MGGSEGALREYRRPMYSRTVAVVLLVALAGLSGCGREDGVDVARPAEPSDAVAPYIGPLYVGPEDARNETERKTGAAGRVISCTTRIGGGFRPGRYEGGETGRSPESGRKTGLDEGTLDGPQQGYLLERQESERALFTYRVDGVAKMAVVLLDGPALGGPAGWHPESWAHCDPSEFPDAALRPGSLEIWTDDQGRRAPTYEIRSSRGAAHCDWTDMTFLTLDEDEEHQYVRRAQTEYVGDFFAERYRTAVPLPRDAVDSGYRRDGRQLWLSADRKRAYVGRPGAATVELWPRTTQMLGCA